MISWSVQVLPKHVGEGAHWALEYGYVILKTQKTKRGKKLIYFIVKGPCYEPKLFQKSFTFDFRDFHMKF